MEITLKLKKFIYIIFVIIFTFIFLSSQNIKKFTITVYNEMGETLDNVLVFKDFVFKGLTDKRGEFSIDVPFKNYYTLYLEKKGYESFMMDITPQWNNNIKIHLTSNSNFLNEETHLEGVATINKKLISNGSFYIKSKGLLREIWTNKDGKFSTNIPDLKNSFFIYVSSKTINNKFIIDYYIENIKLLKNTNNLYIDFSNFNQKSYKIKIENDLSFNTTSLIIYNKSVYYPFIFFWNFNIKNKELIININNLSGKLFDEYNFFYEIFYLPETRKKNIKRYQFFTHNFNLQQKNIELNNKNIKVVKKYNNQEIFIEKQLPDTKISLLIKENKFKQFILMDKTQKVILNYFTNRDSFYIPYSIFDNAYYMSVIYYPDLKDGYMVFLTNTNLTAINNYLKIAITKKIK